MKHLLLFFSATYLFVACNSDSQQNPGTTNEHAAIEGTWKLISGTTIDKADTVVTDYTNGKSFIKVINADHFAFMGHDLQHGKDSASLFYSSGGGKYDLKDSAYIEHLEYCSDRGWEGNDFSFTIHISNDTLVQQGIEKIDSIGVDRINIERYVRLKD